MLQQRKMNECIVLRYLLLSICSTWLKPRALLFDVRLWSSVFFIVCSHMVPFTSPVINQKPNLCSSKTLNQKYALMTGGMSERQAQCTSNLQRNIPLFYDCAILENEPNSMKIPRVDVGKTNGQINLVRAPIRQQLSDSCSGS